jgi:hypothetical protein
VFTEAVSALDQNAHANAIANANANALDKDEDKDTVMIKVRAHKCGLTAQVDFHGRSFMSPTHSTFEHGRQVAFTRLETTRGTRTHSRSHVGTKCGTHVRSY